jgi:FkbM family methyltransferase
MGVMMAMGRYEPSSVALVNEFVRPGMHCVDVGAHNGYFTCLMASLIGPTGRVDSFEPRPQSFDLLEQNVRENRFESIVTTHRLAASDRSGTIDVSHVSHMYVIGRVHNAPKATAQTARIDDAVGGPVDLVKLDVEGHEPLAIDGMRSTIASSRPVILSEANEYWLRHCSQSNASDYCSLLRSLGYEVFDVESRQPIGRLDLQENDVVNLVAFPRGPG